MKKIMQVFLFLVLLMSIISTPIHAAGITVGYNLLENGVYMGGTYDVIATISEGAERATYQWQVDASFGNNSWYDLEESTGTHGYKGTKTSHFQFITEPKDNGNEVGTGWENIPFRCKITLDGIVYYTTPFTMYIYSHSLFKAHIQNEHYEITSEIYKGVSNIVKKDNVYYGEAFAGQELFFQVDYPQVTYDSNYHDSDVRFVREIIIQENGKTKKAEASTYYTPTTIGKDAVVVNYQIRMMMGVNDLGIVDSRKMVITTKDMLAIDEGVARYDMSLLKEMYNESQKLTSIPKNTKVKVVEIIGNTWCKVSHNNYVGYVPKTALDFLEKVSYVGLHIIEPQASDKVRFDISMDTDGYQLYDLSSAFEWYDKTAKEYQYTGDYFVEGHEYRAIIWIERKTGYEFDVYQSNPNVQATMNGHIAKVNVAYEQSPYEVIEVVYDYGPLTKEHTCSVTYVPKVDSTCNKSGKEAYYHCSCGKNYKDASMTTVIDIESWGNIPTTAHEVNNAYSYNGTHHYKKCKKCLTVIPETNGAHKDMNNDGVCDVCGYVITTIHTHMASDNWYKDSSYHWRICSDKNCGVILDETKMYHEDTDHNRTCDTCGHIMSSTHTHTTSDTWGSDEHVHWRTCSSCGVVLDETKMLHEDKNYDRRCDTCGHFTVDKAFVIRIAGSTRYETSTMISQTLRKTITEPIYSSVIVASGSGFADALAGSYLAAQKNAPILMYHPSRVNEIQRYISENLEIGGTIYILGGEKAVGNDIIKGTEEYRTVRLAGATRYETNLKILEEAGVANRDILVCKATGFADSLSASATGRPILLVGNTLRQDQRDFLDSLNGNKIYVLGGESAVNKKIEKDLATYGSVNRIGGATRYETSTKIAREFFDEPKAMVIAYAGNFPDGLCGGPLAYAMHAPMILTQNRNEDSAKQYALDKGVTSGYVLGGSGLVSDATVKNILGKKTE